MSSLTNPIDTIAGQYTIDQSVLPFIRNQAIEFIAHDLKPYSNCSFFFDDVSVNTFVQPASVLTTNIGTYSNAFSLGEGLYCNTTHAYCTVIETSESNLIYVNENYISLNLTPYGPINSNNFNSTSFNVGDIVYQSSNTPNIKANTFVARVVFWNSNDSSIALKVKNGVVSNVGNSAILYKLGNNQLANVANTVIGNKFPSTTKVTATDNVNNYFLVGSWTHNHGIISSVSGNSQQLILSGNVSPNAVNSIISIVSGAGVGQNAKIINVNSNMISLNTSFNDAIYTSNPTSLAAGYAIGNAVVDDVGRVAGIFNIPEDENLKFPAGNRLFTINDASTYNSPAATMRSTSIFAATGSIAPNDTTNQTPVVTQTPTLPAAANTTIVQSVATAGGSLSTAPGSNDPQSSPDPLAQTFTVPTPNTIKQNYGIFITSVDLFFQNAPSGNSTQFPVTVKLAEVVNGFPTTTILATSTVDWAEINVTSGNGSFPDSSNAATYTRFAFDDPVYLAPNQEYAIIVYTESPDYQVWVSNIGDTVVNGTSLVSSSPFVGSFFQAQNSSAWTSINGLMLMFVLNKAQFNTSSTSLTFNASAPVQNVYADLGFLHSSDITFPDANITYELLTTIANTGQQDPSFFEIQPNQLYNFGADLKISTIDSTRRRVVYAGNSSSLQAQVTLSTNDPDISPMFNSERLSFVAVTNMINDTPVSNTNISITSPGNHINAANIVVTISSPTAPDGPTQAYANVLPSQLSGNNLIGINIINGGTGYYQSPTITIREPGAPSNATAVFYGEDQNFGGNGLTRYVTKQITLADGFDSGDIQVFLDCVRPIGTSIYVYYKVMSAQDTDTLSNKPWIPMNLANDITSADQNTSIELNYNTGGTGQLSYTRNGIIYPLGGKFKYFAIKIVLAAEDTTVPPLVQNLRVICVPAG